MAPSKNPISRLRHILEEAAEIEAATKNISFERFRDTWMIRRSVEHGLLIITEAVKALPSEMKSAHPEIAGVKSNPSGIIFATNTGTSTLKRCGESRVGSLSTWSSPCAP